MTLAPDSRAADFDPQARNATHSPVALLALLLTACWSGIAAAQVSDRSGELLQQNVAPVSDPASDTGRDAETTTESATDPDAVSDTDSASISGPIREPINTPDRPFGSALDWLNRIDQDRAPPREKAVLEGAFRGLIPPRQERTGFEPRVTLTTDFTDNLFLAAEPDVRESARTISIAPGFSYENTGRRWTLLADYSLESAAYLNHDDLNESLDAQQGSLSGSLLLSPKTVVGFYNQYRENRDAEGQLLLIPNPNLNRFKANQLVAYGSHNFSPTVSAELLYRNQWQSADGFNASDIVMNEGIATLRFRTGRRDRISLRVGHRDFRFSPGFDQDVQSATLGIEHEFSERLVASISGGWLRSSTGSRRDFLQEQDFLQASGELQYSTKRSVTTFIARRDVTTTPGFGSLLLEDAVGATFSYRLGTGVRLGMDVTFAQYESLNRLALQIDSVEVTPSVSYAFNHGGWLVLRYGYRYQSFDLPFDLGLGPSITSNRLTLGYVKTF